MEDAIRPDSFRQANNTNPQLNPQQYGHATPSCAPHASNATHETAQPPEKRMRSSTTTILPTNTTTTIPQQTAAPSLGNLFTPTRGRVDKNDSSAPRPRRASTGRAMAQSRPPISPIAPRTLLSARTSSPRSPAEGQSEAKLPRREAEDPMDVDEPIHASATEGLRFDFGRTTQSYSRPSGGHAANQHGGANSNAAFSRTPTDGIFGYHSVFSPVPPLPPQTAEVLGSNVSSRGEGGNVNAVNVKPHDPPDVPKVDEHASRLLNGAYWCGPQQPDVEKPTSKGWGYGTTQAISGGITASIYSTQVSWEAGILGRLMRLHHPAHPGSTHVRPPHGHAHPQHQQSRADVQAQAAAVRRERRASFMPNGPWSVVGDRAGDVVGSPTPPRTPTPQAPGKSYPTHPTATPQQSAAHATTHTPTQSAPPAYAQTSTQQYIHTPTQQPAHATVSHDEPGTEVRTTEDGSSDDQMSEDEGDERDAAVEEPVDASPGQASATVVDQEDTQKVPTMQSPRGDVDKGERRMVELTGEHEQQLKEQGNNFYRGLKYDLAAETYTTLINLGGSRAVYFGNRAACFWMLQDYDKCLSDSLKAINIDINFYKGHARAGKVFFLKGELRKAKTHLEKALALDRNAPKSLQMDIANLKKAEQLNSEFEEAWKTYTQGARRFYAREPAFLPPHVVNVARELSDLLTQSVGHHARYIEALCVGSPTRACDAAKKLIAGTPKEGALHYQLGVAYLHLNQLPNAIQSLENALGVDPNHQPSLELLRDAKGFEVDKKLANDAFQQGLYVRANETYTKLIRLRWPETLGLHHLRAVLHCNRAASCKELFKHHDAISDCTEAIRLNPAYGKAYARRGRSHVLLGNPGAAVTDFEAALANGIDDKEKETVESDLREAQKLVQRERTKEQPKPSYFNSHSKPNYFTSPSDRQSASSGGSSARSASGAGFNFRPGAGFGDYGSNHSNSHPQFTFQSTPPTPAKDAKDDHYKTLGVQRAATTEEIKKAFRLLALKLHPDKQSNDEERQETEPKFKAINEAYRTLSSEATRRDYDRTLAFDTNHFFGAKRTWSWTNREA